METSPGVVWWWILLCKRLSATYPVGRGEGEAGLSAITSTFSAGLGSTSERVVDFLARAIDQQLLCWRFPSCRWCQDFGKQQGVVGGTGGYSEEVAVWISRVCSVLPARGIGKCLGFNFGGRGICWQTDSVDENIKKARWAFFHYGSTGAFL